MQNDLISRSDLLKCFCVNKNGERIPEVDCDNFQVSVSIKDIKRIIREQPIAYDMENVVAQIKYLSNNFDTHCDTYADNKCICRSCEECVLKGAIEIVCKGGK